MINEDTKYRVVRRLESGQMFTEEFTNDNLLPAMEVRGFETTGNYASPRTREEMQGAPKFAGLLGPMWDGDAVRYEDAETYRALSA